MAYRCREIKRNIQYWFETSQTPLKIRSKVSKPWNSSHKMWEFCVAEQSVGWNFFLTPFRIIIPQMIKQKERNYISFLSFRLSSPQWGMASSFTTFLDHTDTPRSVGLLWTSDQLIAMTSDNTKKFTTDRHPSPPPPGNLTHNLSRRTA